MQMTRTVLLATAATMLMAVPAMAHGYVGAVYDGTTLDDGTGSDSSSTWQGEGAFGYSGGNWGLQIDGGVGSSNDADLDFWTLAGHVYWTGEGWRLGGVVASSSLEFGGVAEIDEIAYGIEGTLDLGPNTVGVASATIGTLDVPIVLGEHDLWNVDVGINHYIGSNVRVGGKLGIGNADGVAISGNSFSAGLGAEWQPWTAPVSLTVAYSHFATESAFGDVDSDTFSLGLRWSFGGGTLRDRDNATPFDTQTGVYQRLFDLR